MTTIKSQNFINSIADSLQHISYTHPRDFIRVMTRAYEHEKSQGRWKLMINQLRSYLILV